MRVFLSPLAEYKLLKLLQYIEDEWGKPSKKRFLEELETKIKQIYSQPYSSPSIKEFPEIHWCVVTPQSSFYYRLLEQEIEIITITDNRQDPEKIISEIEEHFKK